MKKFKNFIFDLGRVVLPISPQTTSYNFNKLGVKNFDETIVHLKENELFDNFERGKVSANEFISFIQSQSNNNISKNQIIEAWNSMLLDFPSERIDLIRDLSKKYKVFLLSNTNEIHCNFYLSKFKKAFGYDFDSIFTKAYYSHKIGHRKPDLEIYSHVLNEQNLIPQETLFFDDVQHNLDGASKLGIGTQLITDNYTILDYFNPS